MTVVFITFNYENKYTKDPTSKFTSKVELILLL